MFARWSFSFLLLIIYVGTFHLWMHLGRLGIVLSGLEPVCSARGLPCIADWRG